MKRRALRLYQGINELSTYTAKEIFQTGTFTYTKDNQSFGRPIME